MPLETKQIWVGRSMNVNGSNKACDECPGAVELGINSVGMKLYGCKYKQTVCKKGSALLKQIENARQENDKEGCVGI